MKMLSTATLPFILLSILCVVGMGADNVFDTDTDVDVDTEVDTARGIGHVVAGMDTAVVNLEPVGPPRAKQKHTKKKRKRTPVDGCYIWDQLLTPYAAPVVGPAVQDCMYLTSLAPVLQRGWLVDITTCGCTDADATADKCKNTRQNIITAENTRAGQENRASNVRYWNFFPQPNSVCEKCRNIGSGQYGGCDVEAHLKLKIKGISVEI